MQGRARLKWALAMANKIFTGIPVPGSACDGNGIVAVHREVDIVSRKTDIG
jgi:hypothetical protein